MKIQFVSKQVTVTDAIRDYAEKKMQRVKRYFPDNYLDITITLTVQKKGQTVEILINRKGTFIKAIERSEDTYSAIDLAIDKIERQVVKYKDKIKNRKYDDRASATNLHIDVYSADSIDQEEPQVIVTKEFPTKPMSVEEAVVQMELLNKPFFAFKNEVSGELNVVYKRDDGDIGLIQA